jgi:outer membrane receptor for ferrienterochelin and colicin
VRDEALNARNAFSEIRPSGQTRQYSWNLNGPIVRGKTGFALTIDGSRGENQAIRAAAPGGIYANLIEQPSDRLNVWSRVDHSINPAQSIRVDFNPHRRACVQPGSRRI